MPYLLPSLLIHNLVHLFLTRTLSQWQLLVSKFVSVCTNSSGIQCQVPSDEPARTAGGLQRVLALCTLCCYSEHILLGPQFQQSLPEVTPTSPSKCCTVDLILTLFLSFLIKNRVQQSVTPSPFWNAQPAGLRVMRSSP